MDKRVLDLIRTQIPEPNLSASENPLVLFLEEMEAAFATLADDLAPVNDPVVVSDVVIDGGNITYTAGSGGVTLTADVTYSSGSGNGGVIWSLGGVGDTGATISPTGLFNALASGTVTVTATSAEDNTKSDSVAVTVIVEVDSVVISGGNITGGAMTFAAGSAGVPLTATVFYSPGSGNGQVTWTLANDSGTGATIVDGLFNATTAGTVTVIATSVEDTNISGSVAVTVE